MTEPSKPQETTMPTQFERFRKKPVVIEAVQLSKPNWGRLNEFLGMENWRAGKWWANPLKNEVGIVTLEGTMVASEDDWIIKGIKGEFYPCKPDIFAETYEPEAVSPSLESQRVADCLHCGMTVVSKTPIHLGTICDDCEAATAGIDDVRKAAPPSPESTPCTCAAPENPFWHKKTCHVWLKFAAAPPASEMPIAENNHYYDCGICGESKKSCEHLDEINGVESQPQRELAWWKKQALAVTTLLRAKCSDAEWAKLNAMVELAPPAIASCNEYLQKIVVLSRKRLESELSGIMAEIPESFYDGNTIAFRVYQMARIMAALVSANQALEAELATANTRLQELQETLKEVAEYWFVGARDKAHAALTPVVRLDPAPSQKEK